MLKNLRRMMLGSASQRAIVTGFMSLEYLGYCREQVEKAK